MADQKTISTYDAQAAEYATLVQQELPEPALMDFIACLNAGDTVLDLGCGPAHASATMRAQGLQVDPVDASAQMVALANANFDIGARQAQFSDITGDAIYAGVWANFSLLHATAEEFPQILSTLKRALKAEGYLHLGMKLGDGSARDKLQRFYSYYSEAELRQHVETAGFNVQRTNQGADKGLAGDVEPWITLLCQASKLA